MGDVGISFHLLLGRNINEETSIFFLITHIDFVALNMYVATQSGNLCPTQNSRHGTRVEYPHQFPLE
jgi:hypothetical protein